MSGRHKLKISPKKKNLNIHTNQTIKLQSSQTLILLLELVQHNLKPKRIYIFLLHMII